MKAVVQRVSRAKVTVDQEVVGEIGPGLLLFLGIHKDDGLEEVSWLVKKALDLRIFSDDAGKMNRSLRDVNGELLVVSQFTLYGNCAGGRRPDFLESASPEIAVPLYEAFLSEARESLGSVQSGIFGADMQVELVNDGPVTMLLERKKPQ